MTLWGFCRDWKEERNLLRHPVFVRFLIFVFLGGEGSLFVAVGDKSRDLKSSPGVPSGTIATESIADDSMPIYSQKRNSSGF